MINSSDTNALEMLEAKLAKLVDEKEALKEQNKFAKKSDVGYLTEVLGMSHGAANELIKKGGHPSWVLSNLNQNILSVKKRIHEVSSLVKSEEKDEIYKSVEIRHRPKDNRLEAVFQCGRLPVELFKKITRAGFRNKPTISGFSAYYHPHLVSVIKEIADALEAE